MTYDESRYRKGYSIGVGGVVLCGKKALLVRRALGSNIDDWAIPGGFVEHNETIDVAVRREVFEEAGVRAEIEGLIAARSRVSDAENSAYFIFLLRASDESTQADGFEVAGARFFTLDEVQALPQLQALTRLVVTRALRGEASVLKFHTHPQFSPDEYVIYA
jgi:ADP-ribose pyrophosphatase YjhB (NUDIX family)